MNDFSLITQLLLHCNEGLEGATHPDVARTMLVEALREGPMMPPKGSVPRGIGSVLVSSPDRHTDEPSYRGPSASRSAKTPQGKAIRLRRLSLNWTQAEVARRAKVSKWHVHGIEYGRKVPSEIVDRILSVLGPVQPEEFRTAKASGIPRANKRARTPSASRSAQRIYQSNYEKKLRNDASFREFVATLRSLRERVGMPATVLSLKLGQHPQYIQRMENFHTVPNVDRVRDMANTLGVPASTFPDIDSVRVKKPMPKRGSQQEPGLDLPQDAAFHRPAHTDA